MVFGNTGDRFKTNDSGNILLVTIEQSGALPVVTSERVAFYRWDDLEFSFSSAADIAALEALLTQLVAPLDRHIVSLRLSGSLDRLARQQLEFSEPLAAALRFIARRCQRPLRSAHRCRPRPHRQSGFLRCAMNRLRTIHSDPSNPNQPYAAEALSLLYQVHAVGGPNQ